jgi:tetratricopeptide (TPR) repeat protein/predicted Ser/Thr protein kinase
MNEGGLDRVEALFHQAADLPPEGQRALLDDACAGDPGLRAAVEKLLADDARLGTDAGSAAGVLNSPLVRRLPSTDSLPTPADLGARPARVGRYRVGRLLGEGGMGAVYEAEQDNPRRPVALKVIRPGLVSPELLRRFAREAQVLGRLHHPGIAAIYEAGVAEDGQPFFAMELVRGLPLDEHARRQGLTTAARLELLARACDAVQYAHDQGVIHRDLKPSNILVDDSGQPRVLDFGVARATDADLPTGADRTQTGQLVGTLTYMSPEQIADPKALDERSDVYALGVILFELLAGRLPYSFHKHAPLPEVARVILEQVPPRLGALDARLRGDVETVVAKALEKDREQRYASAAELAADLRRHLRQEPIRARPPSALYRLGKFARRHKALVAAAAAFVALVLVGAAVIGWQALTLARTERDEAVRQARRSEEAHAALARAVALREQARAADDVGTWARAREEGKRAEALLEGGPVEPGLAERVAGLLRELDDEEKDRRMVATLETIRLRQVELKGHEFDTAAAEPRYVKAFQAYGLDVEGLPAAEAARRVRASAIREALLAALDNWAWSRTAQGPAQARLWAVADGADDNPWRRGLRQAARRGDAGRLKELAAGARALEQPPPVLVMLGQALDVTGLPAEAATFLRQAQLRHPGDFWINYHLAYILFVRFDRAEDALGYFRAALALRPGSAAVQVGLGTVLKEQGDLPGATACFRRAVALGPGYVAAHSNLGTLLQSQGDLTGAVDSFRRAVALAPKLAIPHYNLGNALWLSGDLPGAVASFRRVLEIDPQHAEAHCNLGHALMRQGALRPALRAFRAGHKLGARRKDWRYPSPQWIERCERFIELDGRLPAILKGEKVPADAAERIDLADLCHYKGLYAGSVRFFTEAFADDARLADHFQARHRFRAACSAALAGRGRGEEAARMRGLALAWLRADLARGAALELIALQTALARWKFEADLAGVREAARLAALPAAERAAWERLWADVAAVLAKRDAK